ncbi:similar to Saccharomyces cerevisiae YOR344C TYE7 Serine-rich protein that contains a basic-helix-loop-helix (bHLH) DNA binding motif [Maudiozyma saulgeensis]|uniref:Similar to Saccharomyces cerevisiae YOR344C TYE7 Serine-rich protein that contains a basic-helix-loop-helix (BHLH) DNA binding motif n=1 Tax=Maudiozyma saulgeensis TaxID=1789683 RepID=A0A1X7R7S6_9SACH|nr:similar to Saccharomyces cerevisiae YOR344C TYE7 Serine-rich protein that contains a basic-helix-loop-helix (bHLH) DNA binding motif [Kazachstania saulgeensis]
MKQTDIINDMVSNGLLNATPTNQTLTSLEEPAGWYAQLESIISSSATSIEDSPHYTTNMDNIGSQRTFRNNLNGKVNTNLNNYNSGSTVQEPIEISTENVDSMNIKTEDEQSLMVEDIYDRSSSTSSANSSNPKTAKVGTTKKNRKKLTSDQKVAHNKIEKRYRININTKIAKLQQIIPWVAANDTAFEVSNIMNSSRSNSIAGGRCNAKVNKSKILDKAVDYIQYLQDNEHLFLNEIQKLREENGKLKATLATQLDSSNCFNA